MKLKVCSVRNMAMVQACQDQMVDYIGFNFVPTSKRKVSATLAQKLSHAFTGKKVGVFMNQPIPEILEVLSVVDLDIIQLHGHESPEFIESLNHLLSTTNQPLLIWKAFRVDQNFDTIILQQYSKNCENFLFDGKNPGSGSQIIDTNVLQNALNKSENLGIKYGLAGGINTKTAPQILKNFPEAEFLDTASGVEENGQFSRDKLLQLNEVLKFEL